MINIKGIKQEISELTTLRNLVRVYEEIASFRMKKARDSVLFNRAYQDSIYAIFEEVRTNYIKQTSALLKKRGKKATKLTFLAHNGKTVAVLLSANTGLYGEIVKKTFDLFLDDIKNRASEATIIGRHGLSLFLSAMPNSPYTYFDLSDTDISSDNLFQIIRHIVQYEVIRVYHGQFQSVIKQKPEDLVISAQISLSPGSSYPKRSYIFEPTLEEILMFFETEIFGSQFEQAVREGQLAKYASRVLAMDRADNNIKNRINKLNLDHLRARHVIGGKKQLNALSGAIFS